MPWLFIVAAGVVAGFSSDRLGVEECPNRHPGRLRATGIAAVTAVLFGVFARTVGFTPVLPAYLCFVAVTLALALVDLCSRRIPNRILFPGTAAAGLLLIGGSLVADGPLLRPVLAGAAFFAAMYGTALVSKGGVGGGDVKLAFLLGLFTGYVSWGTWVVGIVVALLVGGASAVVFLVTGRRSRQDEMAFGPALILGSYAAILAGPPIIRWYLGGGA